MTVYVGQAVPVNVRACAHCSRDELAPTSSILTATGAGPVGRHGPDLVRHELLPALGHQHPQRDRARCGHADRRRCEVLPLLSPRLAFHFPPNLALLYAVFDVRLNAP